MEYILSAFSDEAGSKLSKQIDALKRNNINYMEIRNVDGLSIVNAPKEKVLEVAKILKEEGISVSSIGSPIGKIGIKDAIEPHLELFKYTLEIAKIFDTKYIRMFSFFIPKGQSPEVYKDEVMDRLGKILDIAEGSGVKCCHENEKGIFGEKPQQVVEILDNFKGRMGNIFDPSNYIQAGVVPMDAYKMMEGNIDYFHIKDCRFKDGKVTPAGYGDGTVAEIIKANSKLMDLSGRKEPMFASIEPHLAVFAGYGALGDHTELGTKEFVFESNDQAFDCAVRSFKEILATM